MNEMKTNAAVIITVNGKEVKAPAGTMLLSVLTGQGLRIPTLCHDERLTPYGGCRLCVVARKDGRGVQVPACSTPVQHGMIIETDTPEVIESRRRQLQLLVLNHRMECPVCERRGDCRLQDLVFEYGAEERQLPFDLVRAPRDEQSPVIVRDPEKCIICGKCVRLCYEVQGVAAIGLVNRGLDTRVSTFLDRKLDCEFCGQCVNACPVGALVARPYNSEIPVWLRETASTTCSYCSCGCQVTVENHDGSLQRIKSDPAVSPNHGKLCVKGWLGSDATENPTRLTAPLVRKDGRHVETGWREALESAATGLRKAREAGRPVVGAGSARLTTEDAYLFQRMLRSVIGTPHVDTGPVGGIAGLVNGMLPSTGAPCSTATLEDLAEADVALVMRGDPTRTHPLVKTELVQGVRQRHQKLVIAHALSGGLERLADMDLSLQPATEEILLRGLAARILATRPRATEPCRNLPGFDEWIETIEMYTPETVEEHTGIPKQKVVALASMLADAGKVVAVVVTGLGIPGDEAAVTRAAAELISILERREHSGGVLVLGEKANVQGVVDVGLHPALLPGHRKIEDESSRRLVEDVWGCTLPTTSGWTAREAMAQAAAGNVGALYLVGQDPVPAWPRGFDGQAAVHGSDFVIVQDAFLTQTARLADVVFPVSILGEREGTLVSADGISRELHRVLSPPRSLPQDGQIFVQLASLLGVELPAGSALDDEIGKFVSWPVPGNKALCLEPVDPPSMRPRAAGMLLDASPQLFHSGSLTSYSRQLQELSPTVTARLSPSDAAKLGVRNGEMIRITTEERELLLRARLDGTVLPGTIATLWHGSGDSAATLVNEIDELIEVEVRRSQ